MALLSPEQQLAARIKNSKPVEIEELGGIKLRVVKISGTAANLAAELTKQLEAGKTTQQLFMLEMFQHTLATEDGKLLSKESAQQVLDFMPMAKIAELLSDIRASVPKVSDIAGNSEGSQAVG